jgi:hypothetical protein
MGSEGKARRRQVALSKKYIRIKISSSTKKSPVKDDKEAHRQSRAQDAHSLHMCLPSRRVEKLFQPSKDCAEDFEA